MRVDQFLTSVTVDKRSLGIWDQMSGGARTASANRYRPGGMRGSISLGGTATTENVTVSRLVFRESDDWSVLVLLHTIRVGKAECTITQRPLDIDGNPWGATLVFRGKLVGVTPPDSNSNEDGEALWMLEIEPEG